MLALSTPQQLRRGLARAERGAALDLAETETLLSARGDDLERLTVVAARVRDRGLADAGRPAMVTYSPKVVTTARLFRPRDDWSARGMPLSSPPTKWWRSRRKVRRWVAPRRC
jgi:hypothetical protein